MANNKTNIDRNTDKGDVVAAGSGQNAIGTLEFGRVYTGVVTSTVHGDNFYVVTIDKINATVACRWAAGIFAPLIGIRLNYFPPVQSRVAVLYSKEGLSWIISSLPSEIFDSTSAQSKTMTGMGLEDMELHNIVRGGIGLGVTKPNDLLEGEFEITNNFGVAIQLLTTLVKMQGSERAKIEASLLNDMVRIVSGTFKHFSSFGDFQIYNDGRLNVRWDGTSYEHEAFGKLDKDAPKVELGDKSVDYQDNFNETGRWRFSQFVGFLGDFIHVFVTEPAETLGNIAEDAYRPGKSRVHLHTDGTILMQSVAEIAMERVCRVVVPIEKKRYDDPEGNKKDEIDQLEKSFLELWNYGKDMKKAHYATYQLRQYARWLSCYHSYARFHQMSDDWKIPREDADEVEQTWHNQEKDVETANSGKEEIYDAYATIRIMRDGAILLMDHFGSAVSMSRGNVHISATRHIELDAAGDIRINAGQNIFMKARRNIEIVSVVGGLTLKSRAWFKALCEWGSMWLKSDAKDPGEAGYSPETPDDATQDPEPEVLAGAIVIESGKGQTIIQSERRLTLSAVGEGDDPESITDTTASVLVQSRSQDVRVHGKRNAIIKSNGSNSGRLILDGEAAKAIVAKCTKFLTTATLFDIGKKLTWKGGILSVTQVRAKQGHFSSSVSGPENLGVDLADNEIPYKTHGHHMQKYKESATPLKFAESSDTEPLDTYDSGAVVEVKPHEDNGDPPNGPDWAFFKDDKSFDNSGYKQEPKEDERFQPLAQQRLSDMDDQFNDSDGYEEWDWEQANKLKDGKRVDTSSLPYPGAGAKEKVSTEGAVLYKPLDEEYTDQKPDIAKDMEDAAIKRKFLKYS